MQEEKDDIQNEMQQAESKIEIHIIKNRKILLILYKTSRKQNKC